MLYQCKGFEAFDMSQQEKNRSLFTYSHFLTYLVLTHLLLGLFEWLKWKRG